MLLHLMSTKGIKKRSIPTANATAEGILVPNIPLVGAAAYTGGVVGWLVSINKIWHKVRESYHKSQPEISTAYLYE